MFLLGTDFLGYLGFLGSFRVTGRRNWVLLRTLRVRVPLGPLMTRVAMRLARNRAVALALAVPFCRREAAVSLLLALAAATFLATGLDTAFFTLVAAAAFLGLAAASLVLGAAVFLAAAGALAAPAAGFLAGAAFLGAAAALGAAAGLAAAGLAAAGLAAAGLAAAGLAAPALVEAAGFFSVFFSAGFAAAK